MSDKKTSDTTPSELEARDGTDGVPRSDGLNRRGLLRMAAASAGLAAVGGTVLTACGGGDDATTLDGRKQPLAGPAPKPKVDRPVISCFSSTNNTIILEVCGGATTGAPTGFSVHWMPCDTFKNVYNSVWPSGGSEGLCQASFGGNANNSNWNLGPGLCQKVVIGGLNDADPGVSYNCNDALICDTCYVFRAFAHATSSDPKLQRSEFTATTGGLECTTAACTPTDFNDCDFLTKSQGYYGGNGQAGLLTLIACYGGFGGEFNKDGNQVQAPNPGTVNATLVTVGTVGILTQVCQLSAPLPTSSAANPHGCWVSLQK